MKALLKIGGSILTKPDGAKVDISSIRRITREISLSWFDCYAGKRDKLVLVHGAGYCGHPEAARYKLNDRLIDSKGIYDTHRAVSKLNSIFLNYLFDEGVPVVPIHPLNTIVAKDGRITYLDCNCIERALRNDTLPVIHGDVVFDDLRGCCIVSGDQIVNHMAQKLDVDRIGLATNVDGVYLNGRVLKDITDENISAVLSQKYRHGKTYDVTDGMLGKIRELWDLPVESIIFNGQIEKNILRFLIGESVQGTVVRRIKTSKIRDFERLK